MLMEPAKRQGTEVSTQDLSALRSGVFAQCEVQDRRREAVGMSRFAKSDGGRRCRFGGNGVEVFWMGKWSRQDSAGIAFAARHEAGEAEPHIALHSRRIENTTCGIGTVSLYTYLGIHIINLYSE